MTAFCALLLLAAAESTRVGSIDFFGYGGLDQRGDWLVYIGLAGKTAHAVRYNPAPTGDARLPKPGLDVYDRAMELLFEAARMHAEDDNSHGYAISAYQPLKTVQIAMREYAQRHPRELRDVLASAADERQRIAAAHLLGYADESDEQIAALATASHDPSEHVRNNAVRALAVLADHDPATARKIPAALFIDRRSGCCQQSRRHAMPKRLRGCAGRRWSRSSRWHNGHPDTDSAPGSCWAASPESRNPDCRNSPPPMTPRPS